MLTGNSLRWENGTITGNGVNFSFLNEFVAETLGVTTFTWPRL
jgi:hypothetical protein